VLKSTPDEAVVSLDMTVLLMKSTFNASTSETPAPSQPAHIVGNDIVGDLDGVPLRWSRGEKNTSPPLILCSVVRRRCHCPQRCP